MKIPRTFPIVYITLTCWLAIFQTEAAIKYLTNYCGSNINLNMGYNQTVGVGDDLGGFVFYSQPGGTYRNCEDCSVTITASEPGNFVLLHFRNFAIEDESYCSFDRLKIYSFTERLTPSTGLCGEDLPVDYLVNHRAEIYFVTDESVVESGFEIVVAEISRGSDCGDDLYLCDNGHCINQYLDDDYNLQVSDYCGNDIFISQGEEIDSNEDQTDDTTQPYGCTEYYNETIVNRSDWTVGIIIGCTVGGILVIAIITNFCCVYKCHSARSYAVAPISAVSNTVSYHPGTLDTQPIHFHYLRQPGIHCVQQSLLSDNRQQSYSQNQNQQLFSAPDSTVNSGSIPEASVTPLPPNPHN